MHDLASHANCAPYWIRAVSLLVSKTYLALRARFSAIRARLTGALCMSELHFGGLIGIPILTGLLVRPVFTACFIQCEPRVLAFLTTLLASCLATYLILRRGHPAGTSAPVDAVEFSA